MLPFTFYSSSFKGSHMKSPVASHYGSNEYISTVRVAGIYPVPRCFWGNDSTWFWRYALHSHVPVGCSSSHIIIFPLERLQLLFRLQLSFMQLPASLPWKPLSAPCTSLQHQDPRVHYNRPSAFLWTHHQVKSPRGLCCSCSKEHRAFPPALWKSSSRGIPNPTDARKPSLISKSEIGSRTSELPRPFFSVLSL